MYEEITSCSAACTDHSLRHKNQEMPSKSINWRAILYRLLTGHILDGAARWVRLCTHDWQARLQGGTPNATQSWASQERALLLAPSASQMDRQGTEIWFQGWQTGKACWAISLPAGNPMSSQQTPTDGNSESSDSLGSPPRRKRNSDFLHIYDKPWHSPIFKDLH